MTGQQAADLRTAAELLESEEVRYALGLVEEHQGDRTDAEFAVDVAQHDLLVARVRVLAERAALLPEVD